MAAPLRRQILTTLSVLTLALAGVIFLSARSTLRQEEEQLRVESQSRAASVAAFLDRTVNSANGTPDLALAQRVLTSIPLPAGSVVTVTGEDGVVLARSHDADLYLGKVGTIGERADQPWTGVQSGIDGVKRICTFAPIGTSARQVRVGLPLQLAWDRPLPILPSRSTSAPPPAYMTA